MDDISFNGTVFLFYMILYKISIEIIIQIVQENSSEPLFSRWCQVRACRENVSQVSHNSDETPPNFFSQK